jgi:hypothetical protein
VGPPTSVRKNPSFRRGPQPLDDRHLSNGLYRVAVVEEVIYALGIICVPFGNMSTKKQVNVRLDIVHLKELEDLQPHYGNTNGEVARYLIVEGLEHKHGLSGLREKKAIK